MAVYPIKMMKDESGQPFVPLTSLDAVIGEKNLQYILDAEELSAGHFRVNFKDLEMKDITNSIIVVRWPQITSTVKPSYLKLNNNTEAILYDGTGKEYMDLEDASGTINLLAYDGTKWIQATGSGSGGGHVITDGEGHSMEQQKVLSFVGFNVENDTTNRATKIVNPTPINNLTTTESGQGSLDAYQGNILSKRSVPAGGTKGQVLAKSGNGDHQLQWINQDSDDVVTSDGSIEEIVGLTYEEYKALEASGQLKPTTQYHITDMSDVMTGLTDASMVELNSGENLEDKIALIDVIDQGQNDRLDIAENNIDTMVGTINGLSQSKGRVNDSMTIAFTADTTINFASEAWGHVPVPFDATITNTNPNLYSRTSAGRVKVAEAGTYLISGTLNCDCTNNWSIIFNYDNSFINDVKSAEGAMVNCWLSPLAFDLPAGAEVGLNTRCETPGLSVRFRQHRSYFTITKIV